MNGRPSKKFVPKSRVCAKCGEKLGRQGKLCKGCGLPMHADCFDANGGYCSAQCRS